MLPEAATEAENEFAMSSWPVNDKLLPQSSITFCYFTGEMVP